jgi:hypothetical protein
MGQLHAEPGDPGEGLDVRGFRLFRRALSNPQPANCIPLIDVCWTWRFNISWVREDSDPMRPSLESEHEDGDLQGFGTVDNSAILEFEDDHNIRLLSRRSSVAYPPGDSDPEAQVPTLTTTVESVAGGRNVTYAQAREGLRKRQMLVDRSLRGMALLTMIFALIMMIVCAVSYAQESKILAGSDCNSIAVSSQVRPSISTT